MSPWTNKNLSSKCKWFDICFRHLTPSSLVWSTSQSVLFVPFHRETTSTRISDVGFRFWSRRKLSDSISLSFECPIVINDQLRLSLLYALNFDNGWSFQNLSKFCLFVFSFKKYLITDTTKVKDWQNKSCVLIGVVFSSISSFDNSSFVNEHIHRSSFDICRHQLTELFCRIHSIQVDIVVEDVLRVFVEHVVCRMRRDSDDVLHFLTAYVIITRGSIIVGLR